jgi:hypothetical protein
MNRRLAIAALAFFSSAASPAAAGDWKFDPVLTLNYQRNDSPLYLAAPDAQSETSWLASAELMLTRETPRGGTELLWIPSYERNTNLAEFNHVDHFVRLGWSLTPAVRTSRLRLDFENPSPAQIAVPQARVTTIRAGLGAEFNSSPKNRWSFEGNFNDTSYGTVGAAPPDAPAPPADANQFGLGVSWDRQVSQLTALGLEYGARRIDEGVYGSWDVHGLLGEWRRGAAERLLLTVRLGAAKTFVVEAPVVGTADEQTSMIGNVSLEGPVSRRGDLAGGARYVYSGSGGVQGAVVDQTLFASWTQRTVRLSELRLLGRCSWLDPITEDPTLARTRTRSFRGEWALAFSPRWFAVVSAEILDQTTDGADPDLDRSYTILGAGARWAPLARER